MVQLPLLNEWDLDAAILNCAKQSSLKLIVQKKRGDEGTICVSGVMTSVLSYLVMSCDHHAMIPALHFEGLMFDDIDFAKYILVCY